MMYLKDNTKINKSISYAINNNFHDVYVQIKSNVSMARVVQKESHPRY